jgi:tripartite-type tricarboxylate transporter receptor subunit TctC
MNLSRLFLQLSAAAITAAAAVLPALAQDAFPSKPLTMLVPFPPGGVADTVGRPVAEAMARALGQPMVVENKGGAGGAIGTALAARAAPDGHTLVLGNDATHMLNKLFMKDLAYDPVKDFAPLVLGADNIIVLAVNPSVPATSVAELVAHARQNPGKLSYGSSGKGSPHHLAGELLAQLTDTKLVHVPYRGGGPALTDLMAGHIPMAFLSLAAAVGQMEAGKIRVLAVVGGQRYRRIPDVPTVGETVKGFEVPSWLALFAPAGTPQPIVARLVSEISRALQADDVRPKLENAGLAVVAGPPEALRTAIDTGLARWAKVVETAGITPE